MATEAAPVTASPWPYRLRLIWFIVLVVAVSLWFERHLKTYVSQTAIVGTTVTLFALWKLILDALGVAGEKGPADWLRRAFTSERASGYLGFGTLLFAVAWACTSSIYLTFEGDARGQSSFTVEQWQGGRLMNKPEPLNSYDRFRGQPYLFHFGAEPVEFRIVNPPGYEPLVRDWRLASQLTVRVPRDFARKELHLVQIVPGIDFLGELPKEGEDPPVRYRLELRKVGSTQPEATTVIWPYFETVIYTGMSDAELAAATGDTVREASRRAVQDWLTSERFSAEQQAPKIAQLFAKPQLHAIERLRAGDELEIKLVAVRKNDAGGEEFKVKSQQVFKVPAGASTHLVRFAPTTGGGT
jgi:hypothetical protein